MSRNLDKPIKEPKPNTCQVIKNPDGYFCVRCNWSPDAPKGDDWSCCPKCGGEVRPIKREL